MPEIGDYAGVRTAGWAGRVIRWGTHSKVNHAFVYVGDGLIIEAIWSHVPLDPATRQHIAGWAIAQRGVGYGWADIAALSMAVVLRAVMPRKAATAVIRLVASRIERVDRLICSQLVDKAYLLAGVHLFSDGRYPGEVTPGDLLDLITAAS
jgi:hypothetical protein